MRIDSGVTSWKRAGVLLSMNGLDSQIRRPYGGGPQVAECRNLRRRDVALQ